jgi:hypothetical protein
MEYYDPVLNLREIKLIFRKAPIPAVKRPPDWQLYTVAGKNEGLRQFKESGPVFG